MPFDSPDNKTAGKKNATIKVAFKRRINSKVSKKRVHLKN
jgi:hypothetical protein